MTRAQWWGPAFACLLMTGPMLGGCSGDGDTEGDDERQRVDAAVDASYDARDGVLAAFAEAAGLRPASGQLRFSTCGESYAPRGVITHLTATYAPSSVVSTEQTLRTAADELETAGWTVDAAGGDGPLVAESGDLTAQVEAGGAAVLVRLTSACIETSDDVALDYAERPPEEWEAEDAP